MERVELEMDVDGLDPEWEKARAEAERGEAQDADKQAGE